MVARENGASHGEEVRQMTGKVLLIEDEPHIAEAIRYVLDRDGWRVVTHGDGADAMQVLRRERPDVVILDLMLPGRSGHEILAEIRADPELRGLPVLILSAMGQAQERARAERAGASGFVAKPFGNDEIVRALREVAAQ